MTSLHAESGVVAKPAKSIWLPAGEGESFNIIGGGVRILVDGESTGGRCCMFEVPVPPGDGPPIHRHLREDEFFYVLEGRFKFSIDGREFVGERGSFACAPRGSLHAFRNLGAATGVLLVTCTPAGLEVPFRAVRIPEPGSTTPALTPQQVIALFEKHGITFHGPQLAGE